MGGDRELVLLAALLSGVLVVLGQTWLSLMYGAGLWFGGLYLCRLMSKKDPLMRMVYMRHRIYRAYYPARSTPYRINTPAQARQYR
jgi:type IV secretion system protein VirB3